MRVQRSYPVVYDNANIIRSHVRILFTDFPNKKKLLRVVNRLRREQLRARNFERAEAYEHMKRAVIRVWPESHTRPEKVWPKSAEDWKKWYVRRLCVTDGERLTGIHKVEIIYE